MRTIISPRLSASGHARDLPGIETWILYNQTEDLGIIYLANGNSAYGLLPLRGRCINGVILYSLFTKEGTFRGEMHQDLTVSFDWFFQPFRMVPQPLLS